MPLITIYRDCLYRVNITPEPDMLFGNNIPVYCVESSEQKINVDNYKQELVSNFSRNALIFELVPNQAEQQRLAISQADKPGCVTVASMTSKNVIIRRIIYDASRADEIDLADYLKMNFPTTVLVPVDRLMLINNLNNELILAGSYADAQLRKITMPPHDHTFIRTHNDRGMLNNNETPQQLMEKEKKLYEAGPTLMADQAEQVNFSALNTPPKVIKFTEESTESKKMQRKRKAKQYEDDIEGANKRFEKYYGEYTSAAPEAIELLQAIDRNLAHQIEEIISRNPGVWATVVSSGTNFDETGFTPFFYAAKYSNDREVMTLFLNAIQKQGYKATAMTEPVNDINSRYLGFTVLMIAAKWGTPEILQQLLQFFSGKGQLTSVTKAFEKVINSKVKSGRFIGFSAMHCVCDTPALPNSEQQQRLLANVRLLHEFGAVIDSEALAIVRRRENRELYNLLDSLRGLEQPSFIENASSSLTSSSSSSSSSSNSNLFVPESKASHPSTSTDLGDRVFTFFSNLANSFSTSSSSSSKKPSSKPPHK